MVSLLDVVPTILDWFSIPYPTYKLNKELVQLTGKSLLKNSVNNPPENNFVFASHNLHEATMYYPMRVVRNENFKLIQNLNFKMPFPIDQDFFISPTFQDLLNRTHRKEETYWYKKLSDYYYRPQWELYDLKKDPHELNNVAENYNYESILSKMKSVLRKWQIQTNDPWICSPDSVLENTGKYKKNPQCLPLYNDT